MRYGLKYHNQLPTSNYLKLYNFGIFFAKNNIFYRWILNYRLFFNHTRMWLIFFHNFRYIQRFFNKNLKYYKINSALIGFFKNKINPYYVENEVQISRFTKQHNKKLVLQYFWSLSNNLYSFWRFSFYRLNYKLPPLPINRYLQNIDSFVKLN